MSDLVKEEKRSRNEEIQNLPLEVITDILSRLPVKSLLRIRCVCKSWQALISQSNFIEAHLHRSIENSTTSLLISHDYTNVCCIDYDVCSGDEEVTKLDISFLRDNFLEFVVVGSCNGLLCLTNRNRETLLWNPWTREYKKVPNFSHRLVHGYDFFFYLALGYHLTTKTYKIFGIRNLSKWSEVMVYTLGRGGSWRSLGNVPWSINPCSHVELVGGTHYWITSRIERHHSLSRFLIISLDVGTEELQEIQLPSSISDCCYGTYLGHWKGELALFQPLSGCTIELWTLKGYDVKESDCVKQLVFHEHENTQEVTRFRCLKNGEILRKSIPAGNLIVYDPEKNKATEARIKIPGFNDLLGIFVSSLVSPPHA